MARRSIIALAAMVLFGASAAGGAALAQEAASGLCLMTADEMGDLLGAPIARVDGVELECAYSADPAGRSLQVVLSILPSDPSLDASGQDGLSMVRFDHDTDGRDTTIAGLPVWVAAEGVWVDVGPDLLAVWPNLVFDDAPPPMPDTALAIVELVVPRYLEHPRPSAPPPSGVITRFPAALGDLALDTQPVSAVDLLGEFEMFGPPGSDRVAELRAAVEALGSSADALDAARASAFDLEAGAFLDIIALRALGLDMAALLTPVMGVFVDVEALPPEPRTVAGYPVMLVAPVVDDGFSAQSWFVADGDTLWILEGDEALVDAFLGALVPAAAG